MSTNSLREAAQQALEALDCPGKAKTADEQDAITALKAALAEPVQEPVGYFSVNDYGRWEENENEYGEPLYTTPPQRKPVALRALTDDEIFSAENSIPDEVVSDREWTLWFARTVIGEFCRVNGIKEAA